MKYAGVKSGWGVKPDRSMKLGGTVEPSRCEERGRSRQLRSQDKGSSCQA